MCRRVLSELFDGTPSEAGGIACDEERLAYTVIGRWSANLSDTYGPLSYGFPPASAVMSFSGSQEVDGMC